MSKRSGFSRAPKFKPQVKMVNRVKPTISFGSSSEKVAVLPAPIKSEADKKLYKTIRLNNGLTALLISDPSRPAHQDDASSSEESSSGEDSTGSESEASVHSENSDQPPSKKHDYDEEKLAACALSVGAGSYSDPPDIQGLAHFVEHMVFMGSEKYPKENEFDSFIKKKGGSDNASTDSEMTTFFFEVQEKHLARAMDMFSQFFVSPLMSEDAMQREIEAIESEFALAKPSEGNRREQLLASLFPAEHPARTFTWGSVRSLRSPRLHAAAHAFRQRHYSAHRMTVAVQARMDLETLEQYVAGTFGLVPTNDLPPDDFSAHAFRPGPAPPAFASLYYVKPVTEVNELHITWCARSLMAEYRSKPHQYVSYLLGHEGRGSLLSYLREKVWALGIYTGSSESGLTYTTMYSLFSAQVVLTREGLAHVDEVIEAIFSYINMLKHLGPSERIFNEIKTIEDTSFRFAEEATPADAVESLAENMQLYPPEHYITGDKLYYTYDPEGITQLLQCMRADAANVIVLANAHAAPARYDTREEWFGTEYRREEIPAEKIARWSTVAPLAAFHLPEENVFITTDFTVLPPAEPYAAAARRLGVSLEAPARALHRAAAAAAPAPALLRRGELSATVHDFRLDRPNLLRKSPQLELWYKPEFKWRLPTALLYFYFITPLSLRSPRDACLLDLWNDVLQQGLKEEVYPADMAGLQHALYVADRGLVLKVSGYSQNIHLLSELVTSHMRAGPARASPALFAAVRDIRARAYHNVLIKPHKLAKDLRMSALLQPYVSPRDKAALVGRLTLDDLHDFHTRLWEQIYVQMLVQGNLGWWQALGAAERLQAALAWGALPDEHFPNLKVRELPPGARALRVASFNTNSANSVVTNYYQAERATPAHTAALEILMMLMEEPVFDQLRTKEQLGYSVFSVMRYTFGVLGFSVTVNSQADKFSVAHVDARVEAFLRKFVRDARRLSERALAGPRAALVQLKHAADLELKDEAERNWREIVSREYNFYRLFEEAEALEAVRVADVRAWVDAHFPSGANTHYRKLSVQVSGRATADGNASAVEPATPANYSLQYLPPAAAAPAPAPAATDVTDLDAFCRELPFIHVPPAPVPGC